jgi:F420 biosynthesis protein FbiB-like protein
MGTIRAQRAALAFHVVLRGQLVDAMGSKYASDLARAGNLTAEQVARASKSRNQRFLDAPVLLLAFVDHGTLDVHEDQARTAAEGTMGIQSVAAALQTLLLALHVIGLRACWYCAPLFADNIVHNVLRVPASWHAQAFIAVGKPTTDNAVEQRSDGRMPSTERRAVGEISFEPWQFIDRRGDGTQA